MAGLMRKPANRLNIDVRFPAMIPATLLSGKTCHQDISERMHAYNNASNTWNILGRRDCLSIFSKASRRSVRRLEIIPKGVVRAHAR